MSHGAVLQRSNGGQTSRCCWLHYQSSTNDVNAINSLAVTRRTEYDGSIKGMVSWRWQIYSSFGKNFNFYMFDLMEVGAKMQSSSLDFPQRSWYNSGEVESKTCNTAANLSYQTFYQIREHNIQNSQLKINLYYYMNECKYSWWINQEKC